MFKIMITVAGFRQDTFSLLTQNRADAANPLHAGYLEFDVTSIQAALNEISVITGHYCSDAVKEYKIDEEVYYHVHYASPRNIKSALLGDNNHNNSNQSRRSRRLASHQFVNQKELILPVEHHFLKTLYEQIHQHLYEQPKRLYASCGGASGRSAQWRRPVSEKHSTSGYAYAQKKNARIDYLAIYNYFFNEYKQTHETLAEPTLLVQKDESPTKRSPGGRGYYPLDGMGVDFFYVVGEAAEEESEPVQKATKHCKRLKFDDDDVVTAAPPVAISNSGMENETVEEITANRDILRALLAARKAVAPLFYREVSLDPECSLTKEADEYIELDETSDESEVEVEAANAKVESKEKKNNQYSMSFFLDRQRLQKTKKQKEKNNNKRAISQNSIFMNSADKAAIECAFSDEQGLVGIHWEWTHLIAHEFKGSGPKDPGAQIAGNLVLATAHCNTAMMHLEFAIKKLILAGHKIKLDVSAEADNSTDARKKYHCVKRIFYTLTIDEETKVSFQFDPFLSLIPPKDLYVSMLANIVYEVAKPKTFSANNKLDLNRCKLPMVELRKTSQKTELESLSLFKSAKKTDNNSAKKNRYAGMENDDRLPAFLLAKRKIMS